MQSDLPWIRDRGTGSPFSPTGDVVIIRVDVGPKLGLFKLTVFIQWWTVALDELVRLSAICLIGG